MLHVFMPMVSRGEPAGWVLVDEDVADRLDHRTIVLGSHGYATVREGKRRELLHRWILGLQPGDGKVVDHRNRYKLDCSKRNLRVGTQATNMQNLPRSPYCGTSCCKGKWQARAKANGQVIHLGTFDTREEAAEVARAYRVEHYPYAETP
jgi:hypothetical protein